MGNLYYWLRDRAPPTQEGETIHPSIGWKRSPYLRCRCRESYSIRGFIGQLSCVKDAQKFWVKRKLEATTKQNNNSLQILWYESSMITWLKERSFITIGVYHPAAKCDYTVGHSSRSPSDLPKVFTISKVADSSFITGCVIAGWLSGLIDNSAGA